MSNKRYVEILEKDNYIINHNLDSYDIIVHFQKPDKSQMFVGFDIISNNSIRIHEHQYMMNENYDIFDFYKYELKGVKVVILCL